MTAVSGGRLVVVPRSRWHRVELDGPSDLMSITLRRNSQLAQRTAADLFEAPQHHDATVPRRGDRREGPGCAPLGSEAAVDERGFG